MVCAHTTHMHMHRVDNIFVVQSEEGSSTMGSSWQLLCINSSYTLEVNILKGICTMQHYDKDREAWTALDLGQVQELRLSQISCLHIKRQ